MACGGSLLYNGRNKQCVIKILALLLRTSLFAFLSWHMLLASIVTTIFTFVIPLLDLEQEKLDKQCSYNVPLRRLRATIVVMGNQ